MILVFVLWPHIGHPYIYIPVHKQWHALLLYNHYCKKIWKRATLLLVRKRPPHIYFSILLFWCCFIPSSFNPFYITTYLLLCMCTTRIYKVERKKQLWLTIYPCNSLGLIYFSNFSRPGSSNSNNNSNGHRIGKSTSTYYLRLSP